MEINKNELKDALEVVKPGLANKEILEQTTSFAFLGSRVATYNDEISISHPVVDLNIKGAIKADELYKFLGKLKKDEITVASKDDQILFKSGRAKVGFMVAKDINLPIQEEIGDKMDWKPVPKRFLEAIGFAADTCSKDLSNPKLICVHINEKGYVEGTDNYRIVHYKVKNIPVSTVLVPATSIKEVIKVKPKYMAVSDNWIHFKSEADTIISCRLFNEKYVNTKGILNTPEEGIELIFPDSLSEVLEKAHIFAERKSVIDENVDIELKKKKIIVKSSSETGWFEESVSSKYKGKDFTFSITPYLLKGILKETDRCVIYADRLKFAGKGWVYITALRQVSK